MDCHEIPWTYINMHESSQTYMKIHKRKKNNKIQLNSQKTINIYKDSGQITKQWNVMNIPESRRVWSPNHSFFWHITSNTLTSAVGLQLMWQDRPLTCRSFFQIRPLILRDSCSNFLPTLGSSLTFRSDPPLCSFLEGSGRTWRSNKLSHDNAEPLNFGSIFLRHCIVTGPR